MLKGVGRIYQQTFVDTYAKVAAAKLYTTKTPITSADLLNDRVLPMFQEHELPLLRILTDRGTEYCGRPGATRLPAISGNQRYRPHQDQGENAADEWHLRTLP
jgi:hypothetical protein